MPSKKAPKIKVEEVVEDKAPVADEPKKASKPETEEKEVPSQTVPKVTSFSQLDTMSGSAKADESAPEEKAKEETAPVAEHDNDLKPDPETAATKETADLPDDKDMSSSDVKEWLKDIRPDTTKDVEKSGNGFNGKLFFVLLFVFIVLGALAGGLFYYKQKVAPPSNENKTTGEPTAAATVTPTVAEKVDLSKYKVNVLNGSGTAGEAGVVKELMVSAGFSDANIKTGNAKTYDYKNTTVQLKSGTPAIISDAITKALSDKYTVEIQKDNLTDSSNYDIVVTVGQKK